MLSSGIRRRTRSDGPDGPAATLRRGPTTDREAVDVPLLEDLTAGIEWPPPDHADRIARQVDYGTIYRNRRDEILQRWNLELARFIDRQEELVTFPAAKIAARTLAAFLFGEDPGLTHDLDPVQQRLADLAEATNLPALLLEAAITQSVEGEVYGKPNWNRDVDPDHALLSFVPGSRALPEFRFGRLVELAIVREIVDPGRKRGAQTSVYWRHLEIHTVDPANGEGLITNRLYRGRPDTLGEEVDLDERAETSELPEQVATGTPGILPVHVPLGRDLEGAHGVSLFDGLEGLILGLHRLYSQEQHDAELARKRIAIAEQYVGRTASGRPTMDRRSDMLVMTDEAAGAIGAEGKPVHPIEFDDDNVQRERIAGRFRDFLISCGIAPDTIDAQESGGAISGTSRKLAQSLTLQTTAMVGRYWQHEIGRLVMRALDVERVHLERPVDGLPDRLTSSDLATVTLADGLIDDPAELARILADLDTAEAISTEQKVEKLHPEWDAEQVAEEVGRIRASAPPAPPAVTPFGGLRTVDDGGDDGGDELEDDADAAGA